MCKNLTLNLHAQVYFPMSLKETQLLKRMILGAIAHK